MLNLTTILVINSSVRTAVNLCGRFTDQDLASIGGHCYEGYARDQSSRASWLERTSSALDLAMQIAKPKNFPWPGASNVIFPLISIASLQFSARSYSNIIKGTDVVRYRVTNTDPTGNLTKQATRISRHMSWQNVEQDSGWEEQHDRLLINLSVVGFNFIKSYYSGTLNHNVNELVLAQNLVFDYWAKSIESCARKTQRIPLYRNEVVTRVREGLFRDILNESWFRSPAPSVSAHPNTPNARAGVNPPADGSDDDAPFMFCEQHCWLDLDDDGYAEPYIITFSETSRQVVRIVARWETEEDVKRNDQGEITSISSSEYFTKFGFVPSPDGSIYDIGFGAMLGPLNEAVNSGINQLIDCGTMNNSAGGFLGKGAKFKGGVYTMAPWEWKRVDATGDDLRKSMVPLQAREPSMVLYRLLEMLINYTQRLSGATDIMQGETPGQNTPAETSRNALEQGMQIYSTIFKRIWRSLREEFKKQHRLNSIYLPLKTNFGSEGEFVLREDYKTNPDFVVPVADPSVTSAAQKMARAQAIRQASLQVGAGYDPEAVERNFLSALDIEGIEILYPGLKKFPPGENLKVSIEKLRMQLKQGEMQLEWQKFQATLAEQHRLNSAQMATLEAQALSLMAKVDDAKAQQQAQVLQTILDGMKHHNDTITKRMAIAQKAASDQQSLEADQAAQSDQASQESSDATQ